MAVKSRIPTMPILLVIAILLIIGVEALTYFAVSSSYQNQIKELIAKAEKNTKAMTDSFNQTNSQAMQAQQQAIQAQKETDTGFFKNYTIATINQQRAELYFRLALLNYASAEYEINYAKEGYSYSVIKGYYDTALEELTKSKNWLNIAKKKLEELPIAPTVFFKEAIANDLKRIDALIMIINIEYNINDYSEKMLYEINYGTEEKSGEYLIKANDAIEEFNVALDNLNKVSNKIDIQWEQNWYAS